MILKHRGRLYKKEGTRWFVDSRKRWRPVYDENRLDMLRQLEKEQTDGRHIEDAVHTAPEKDSA